MTDDAELKKAGLKVTLPRLRILELLEHDKAHLSAEEIYRKLAEAGEDVVVYSDSSDYAANLEMASSLYKSTISLI